ncbi:hypothetical protein BLOT_014017 [Blomia tropicalis]|nr:hypothetical protein BLOT_014017 [Blomia tropicalis]
MNSFPAIFPVKRFYTRNVKLVVIKKCEDNDKATVTYNQDDCNDLLNSMARLLCRRKGTTADIDITVNANSSSTFNKY